MTAKTRVPPEQAQCACAVNYLVEVEEAVDSKDESTAGGHGDRHGAYTVERKDFPGPNKRREPFLEK